MGKGGDSGRTGLQVMDIRRRVFGGLWEVALD